MILRGENVNVWAYGYSDKLVSQVTIKDTFSTRKPKESSRSADWDRKVDQEKKTQSTYGGTSSSSRDKEKNKLQTQVVQQDESPNSEHS